jgi:hypothetical protein
MSDSRIPAANNRCAATSISENCNTDCAASRLIASINRCARTLLPSSVVNAFSVAIACEPARNSAAAAPPNAPVITVPNRAAFAVI